MGGRPSLASIADGIVETLQRQLIDVVHALNFAPDLPAPQLIVSGITSLNTATILGAVEKGIITADGDVEQAIREEAASKVKNVREGTVDYEIALQNAMRDVKKRMGLI